VLYLSLQIKFESTICKHEKRHNVAILKWHRSHVAVTSSNCNFVQPVDHEIEVLFVPRGVVLVLGSSSRSSQIFYGQNIEEDVDDRRGK
jgi:hypothetical protein